MSVDYLPIACATHERLEFAVLRRRRLRLVWWSEEGGQQFSEEVLPLAACRTLVVDSENRPQRGQFLPDLQTHSPAMGQKADEKWAAADDLQPTIPKSDRLLDVETRDGAEWLTLLQRGDGARERLRLDRIRSVDEA